MKDYYTKEYDAEEAKKYALYSVDELNKMIADDLVECGLFADVEDALQRLKELDIDVLSK